MAESSAEIAAQLREMILSGQLKPGDMLPSAREITSSWNVAIATASRVHALLRSEGLAAPIVGLGTVVVSAQGNTGLNGQVRETKRQNPKDMNPIAQAPPGLIADRIVAAGVAIADVEGLDSLSVRRIAHALRTSPTTLYRFHQSKSRLLSRMVDRVLREWSPGEGGETWRQQLISGHRELWQIFRRHPWLASQLSVVRPQINPGALAFGDWAVRTIQLGGIDLEEAFEAHIVLFNQVRGTAVLLEAEAEAEATTGVDADTWLEERMGILREVSSKGNHRTLASLTDSGYVLDFDRTFERGLELLIEGIGSRSPRRPATGRSRF